MKSQNIDHSVIVIAASSSFIKSKKNYLNRSEYTYTLHKLFKTKWNGRKRQTTEFGNNYQIENNAVHTNGKVRIFLSLFSFNPFLF